MFSHLHIYDPRERAAVGVADAMLGAWAAAARLLPGRQPAQPPRRVLVLRLERIGDLVMTLGALSRLRAMLPEAEIDLVVGSWNEGLARLASSVTRVEPLDVPWLAREAAGAQGLELARRAWKWRGRHYDLAVNFEGDIRSNLLLAVSGAPARAGFFSGGGGPLLTLALPHDPRKHTADNANALLDGLAGTLGLPSPPAGEELPPLAIPADALATADEALAPVRGRLLVGLHASGGREIKQWHPFRFGEAVGRIACERNAAVVLTGSTGEQALVESARAALPAGVPVVDLVGRMDLVTLAAVLRRLTLFVTGDTGPMHLAAAVGTPIVAIFGPSAPARYAPIARHHRIVRIDLPCSPCNQIRLPPARCRGHVPDCLEGISSDMVYRAAVDLMAEVESAAARGGA